MDKMTERAKAPAMARSAQVGDAAAVAAQNFVQVNPRFRSRPLRQSESNVLSSFQVERVGADVRIIDADGSVYKGKVLGPTAHGGGGGVGGLTRQAAPADKDLDGSANWAFKVSGTNKNLRQNVVFTGNVLDMPVAIEPAPAPVAADFGVQNAVGDGNAPQVQNAQISQNAATANGIAPAQNSLPVTSANAPPPAGAVFRNAGQYGNAPQAQDAQNVQNAQNTSNARGSFSTQNSPAAASANGVFLNGVQNGNASQNQITSNARRSQQAQNPLITGKVKVGGGKEFEIEAKPSAP
jgi:hypothetical protein